MSADREAIARLVRFVEGETPRTLYRLPNGRFDPMREDVVALLAALPCTGDRVSTEMVNSAWTEGKNRRMTGLPSDFRAVLEAALLASPSTAGGTA